MNYSINKEEQEVLIKQLASVEAVLEELIKFTDDNFMPNVKGFQQYYQEVKLLCNNLEQISVTLLKEEAAYKLGLIYHQSSEACSLHFNRLIEDFQFHDIIYQKLEHLKKINTQLLSELKAGAGSASVPSGYTFILKELLIFYMEQLTLIQEEYTFSFRKIKTHLKQIHQEVEKVQEVVWQHGEAAFFNEPHIIDLPDHIIRAKMLEADLQRRIREIETAKEFIDNLLRLKKQLKTLLTLVGKLKELNSLKERQTVVTELSQIFTMESERELWGKVVQAAGLDFVLEGRQSQDTENSSIDLF